MKFRTIAGAVALMVLMSVGTAASADEYHPETRAVITKAEYRTIHQGQSYAKVKRIADGAGEYIGRCVEGGRLCTATSRWYWWRSTNGHAVWVGFDGGEVKRKFRA